MKQIKKSKEKKPQNQAEKKSSYDVLLLYIFQQEQVFNGYDVCQYL